MDEQMFSDEIKEMEGIISSLRGELTQELGVPVNIRLKEKGSFVYAPTTSCIEDLRSPQN
jgi:hypothetical protein